jgi:hypothetical protein
MAHDASFVAGIRQVRNGLTRLVCDSIVLSAEMFGNSFCQFDFEWHGNLQCSQQPRGLLWMIEHQGLSTLANQVKISQRK